MSESGSASVSCPACPPGGTCLFPTFTRVGLDVSFLVNAWSGHVGNKPESAPRVMGVVGDVGTSLGGAHAHPALAGGEPCRSPYLFPIWGAPLFPLPPGYFHVTFPGPSLASLSLVFEECFMSFSFLNSRWPLACLSFDSPTPLQAGCTCVRTQVHTCTFPSAFSSLSVQDQSRRWDGLTQTVPGALCHPGSSSIRQPDGRGPRQWRHC